MENPEDDEIKQVCMQLDGILDNFFQTLNKLLATRQELEQTVKEGFYLMARARYSMGVKSVTSTQYNNDDLQKAFSHVTVLPSSDGDITFQAEITSSKARVPASGLLRDSKEIGASSGKGDPECVELDEFGYEVLDSDIQESVEVPVGLRRRILPKDSASDVDRSSSDANDTPPPVEDLINGVTRLTCDTESTKQNTSASSSRSEDDEECETRHGKDPLLWFGILVPQPLRQSQAAFKNAITLSCQIATLQNQLDQAKKSYEKMIARKHELQVQLRELSASVTNHSVDQQEDSPLSEDIPAEVPLPAE